MGLSVFVAIAPEDKAHLDAFAAQARRAKLPFQFVEMLARDHSEERRKSDTRLQIRSAGGVIGLISRHSANDPWQLWSIQCALAERKPVLLMEGSQDERDVPRTFAGKRVDSCSWANARTFLDSLWHEASRSR